MADLLFGCFGFSSTSAKRTMECFIYYSAHTVVYYSTVISVEKSKQDTTVVDFPITDSAKMLNYLEVGAIETD